MSIWARHWIWYGVEGCRVQCDIEATSVNLQIDYK